MILDIEKSKDLSKKWNEERQGNKNFLEVKLLTKGSWVFH